MPGKNLTFKLIMEGDNKGLVTSAKQSQEVFTKLYDTIKTQADQVRKASEETSKAVANIAPSETKQKIAQLVKEFTAASQAIGVLGSDAILSAESIKQIGEYAQQSIQQLEENLKAAKIQLNYLSATNATPSDINNAQREVSELELGIEQAGFAFNVYKDAANQAAIATEKLDDSKSIPELKQQLEAAKNELLKLSQATKGVSLEQFGAASQKVHELEVELDQLGKESVTVASEVKKLDTELSQTNVELKNTETTAKSVTNELGGLKTGFNAITTGLAALGIGVTAQEIAQVADQYKNLSGRISIAIGEHGNLQQAMDDVRNIAIATNSNLTATGDLYSRLTKIGQESKWSQEQVLGLTETINKAIQVGGGSAASNEAAITQLNQALGSGVLRGDEFNSMMEQSPRLTQALADGLGVTTGKLRELAGEGKLTTDVVTKALLSQSEKISAEYAKFPATIGAAIENLKTAWTVYIGEADAATGASAKVAESLKYVAENLDSIMGMLNLAARAFIAYKALNIANTFLDKAAGVRAASVAIAQETTAVVANTQAQLTNAAATRGAAAAKTQLATNSVVATRAVATTGGSIMTLVGRLGALGIAVTAVGVLIPTVFEPLGTAIGEGLAKSVEKAEMAFSNLGKATKDKQYLTAIEQLESATKTEAAQAKVAADIKAEYAAAAEKARDKTYQLTEESKKLVTQFDELVKKGELTKDALEKISNAMKFDSTKGINDSVTALILLRDQGKITADQLQEKLGKALDGKDLLVFATNAKAAFAGTSQEAAKSAALTEAVMKAALGRTGLDTEQLKGKFSTAFQSASNDVQIIISNLEAYKAQGIDTGLALSTNLNKAIDTAQTRAEIDYAKSSLIEFGKQGLITGEQVALGLTKIEQKAQQLPAVLNPAQAAFAAMGIKTKEQLNEAANVAKANFDVVKKSGMATAGGIQQAYTDMLNTTIATGDQAQIAMAQAQAASLGLEVQMDSTGKAVVAKLGEMQQAAVATQRTIQQVSNSSSNSKSEEATADNSNDYWDAFKKKMADRTAKSNAAAQARRSSNANGVKAPIGTDSALTTQPVIPDAPMIASSFDVTPIESTVPKQTVEIKIDMGIGQTATVSAAPDQADALKALMLQLEKEKRG